MPPEERAICIRLLKFRKSTGLSRVQFGRIVGMDPRLLASYEFARSQLNYPAAFQILSRFPMLNAVWLAEAGEPMEVEAYITYPSPEELEFGPRARFSAVYQAVLRSRIYSSRGAWLRGAKSAFPLFRLTPDAAGRLRAEDLLRVWLRRWLSYLPDEKLNKYLDDLKLQARTLLEKYMKAAERTEESYADEARLRSAEVKNLHLQMQAAFLKGAAGVVEGMGQGSAKNDLTERASAVKSIGVKAQLPSLLEELRKATAQPGKKTELAKFLHARLESVSRWLAGKREPGGETVLKMQAWLKRPK